MKTDTENIHHIISRSIASYQIFNNDNDYIRMFNLLRYYQIKSPPCSYAVFIRQKAVKLLGFNAFFKEATKNNDKLVDVIAYCLMPNHIHLALRQLSCGGISIFMSNLLNSYTRYFNLLHKRKGPLWESRFKRVLVTSDEQLLHLTRYIHLNATSANLVSKPELWKYSSYQEYIQSNDDKLTNREGLIDMSPRDYMKFVDDRKDYQRQLSIIKKILI